LDPESPANNHQSLLAIDQPLYSSHPPSAAVSYKSNTHPSGKL